MSRRARLPLAVVGAGVLVLAALPAAWAADPDAELVLERARTATAREDFSGLVQIEWRSGGEWQVEVVHVDDTGGTVQVGTGLRRAQGSGHERWVADVGGWQAGWSEPVIFELPAPHRRWDLSLSAADVVAGRATDVVVAVDPRSGRTRLRVYADRETGVMLRREVLDRQGRVARVVGFVHVGGLDGTRADPPVRPHASARDTAPTAITSLPKALGAPTKVRGGYVLAGRYLRDDGVVQLYYTDGLFGVSVFEQRGSVEWGGLPEGGIVVSVDDGVQARGYKLAGGTVLVWDRDRVTRTVVSDMTLADLREFAVAFDDRARRDHGVLHDVVDFVLSPFRW